VIAAINFNDQPNGWREEIHDEAEQRHLAPETQRRADLNEERAKGELPNRWALGGGGERDLRGKRLCWTKAAPFPGWRPDEATPAQEV